MSGESYIAQAQQCAHLFRLGRDVEAGLMMAELVDAVHSSFDSSAASLQQQWAFVLGQMLACQESQNWLALADYLQYELVELLTEHPSF